MEKAISLTNIDASSYYAHTTGPRGHFKVFSYIFYLEEEEQIAFICVLPLTKLNISNQSTCRETCIHYLYSCMPLPALFHPSCNGSYA